MIPSAPFSLDSRTVPESQDLGGLIAGDLAFVEVVVTELAAADVIVQASFTAKVNKADSDTAPTTVQVVYGPGELANATVTPIGITGTQYLLTFPLTQQQTQILNAPHGYDVRVWVRCVDGTTRNRTVQSGAVTAAAGWTTLSSSTPDAATVALTSVAIALAAGAVTFSGAAAVRNVSALAVQGAMILAGVVAATDPNVLAAAGLGCYWKYSAGDPILNLGGTFTRASTATYTDVNGVVQTAASGVLRDGHYISGVGPYTLLEATRTNLVLHSSDASNPTWSLNTAGAGSLPVVTANSGVDPSGNMAAAKVVFAAPGVGDRSSIASSAVTLALGSVYTGSLWAKAFAAGDIGKTIIFRGAGAAAYTNIVLTAAWQNVSAAETAAGTTENLVVELRPGSGSSSSGTVSCYLTFGQMELGSFASSYIPTTTTAVTRAADALSFPWANLPSAMTVYYNGVELGSVLSPNATRGWEVGNDASAGYFALRVNGSGKYNAIWLTGSGNSSSTAAAAPIIGNVVETRATLSSVGVVQLGQAINGGAEVVAAAGGALPLLSAFNTQALRPNGFGSEAGFFAIAKIVIATGVQTLAVMQGL